jgi:dihydrofolate synthase/folylpolyglutamate synthase
MTTAAGGWPESAPAAQTSDVVLERLLRLHPKIIDLSLDRVWRLLERLGRPDQALPPVIHVAGTNGKGSLIAFLRAMLEAAGYRVHAYTSPHLVRFHERIRLNGDLIAEADLLNLLEEAERANGSEPITFFEVTTCAAFLAFSRQPADILLLETGLGGRLDATNVIPKPALTAITPVSMDHMQYLGDSLAAIAREKAGILKPGAPAVVAAQQAEALSAIEGRAREIGAPLSLGGRDWTFSVEAAGEGFTFQGADGVPRRYPAPRLLGAYQNDNAAVALACVEALRDFRIGNAAIEAGLARAVWPGRMQRLARGPLAESLPNGWELWLDGGHNAAAAAALGSAIDAWNADSGARRPLHVVFGMINSKVPVDFLRPLAARADSLTAVAIPGEPASHSAAESAGFARAAGAANVGEAGSVAEAVSAVATVAGADHTPARILICGSLYLAGKVLADNG